MLGSLQTFDMMHSFHKTLVNFISCYFCAIQALSLRKALGREGNCSDDDKHPSQLQTKNRKQKDSDDLIQTGNEHIGDEKWSWAQKNAETRPDWHTSKA